MLFCQLGQAKSLPEIHEGLRASEGKLRHLRQRDAPSRSTLAYANQHRPDELFGDLFLQTYQRSVLGQKIHIPHKLYSLDATVIDLCAQVFDQARFQVTKGAIKLHLFLDRDGHLPSYARSSRRGRSMTSGSHSR